MVARCVGNDCNFRSYRYLAQAFIETDNLTGVRSDENYAAFRLRCTALSLGLHKKSHIKLSFINQLLLIFSYFKCMLNINNETNLENFMVKNENLGKIQAVSRKLRLLFSIMIYGVPIITILYWLLFNHLPNDLIGRLPAINNSALPMMSIVLAIVVSFIPVSVVTVGLITLKKLFSLYENAVVFSIENVICFRRLGYTLISLVFANAVFITLISLVLSFNNPVGERVIVAEFGVSDIATILIGLVVVIISWVMKEASKMEYEQAHTV